MGIAGFAYLVVLSHGMDDIPLRLFGDCGEAFSFARTTDWQPSDNLLRLLELPDCSSPNLIAIVTYRDGTPVSRVIVREFDAEAESLSID